MDFLGDLAFLIGTVGIVIYICLIIIRFTNRAGKVKRRIKQYEEQAARLQERIEELKKQREAIHPQVDALVNRVVELREVRDRLQFQYKEMIERSREREIHIRRSAH